MNNFKLLLFLLLLGPSLASATEIDQLGPFTVENWMMSGMEVFVEFSDGSSDIDQWHYINSTVSGADGTTADGTTWSLQNISIPTWNDTMDNPWVLSTTSLVGIDSITINALSGNVVFDIINRKPNPDFPQNSNVEFIADERTYGSKQGYWEGNGLIGTASASNGIVDINGVFLSWAFYDLITVDNDTTTVLGEDLWGSLKLTFNDPLNPFIATQNATGGSIVPAEFIFSLDTDSTLENPPPPIPEPSTMLLFGFGLLGLCAAGRRKE